MKAAGSAVQVIRIDLSTHGIWAVAERQSGGID
jgi:hypothetical protein